MLKNNKGISLITVIMTVIVIIILLSTITYTVTNNIEMKKINELYSDLREITDAVQLYYAKHAKLPITSEKYIVTAESVKLIDDDTEKKEYNSLEEAKLKFILKEEGLSFEKSNLYNPNDYDSNVENGKAVYYKINMSLFDNITLENSGTYLVNEKSKSIYYFDGINVKNKNYHKLPLTYIDIPYVEKENIKMSDIYLPLNESIALDLEDLLEWNKEPIDIQFEVEIEEDYKDYIKFDSEEKTLSTTINRNLDFTSNIVGTITATIQDYRGKNIEKEAKIYITGVYYLEDNNTQNELEEIYIPIDNLSSETNVSYKIIKAYKNGAAGNLNFNINNNYYDENNSNNYADINTPTNASYEILLEDEETDAENEEKYEQIKIFAGNVTGKAILTVGEDRGDAYKNLNVNIVNPVLLNNDNRIETKSSEMKSDILTDINNVISISETTEYTISLSGLEVFDDEDEGIDWSYLDNNIEWILESSTDDVDVMSIIDLPNSEDGAIPMDSVNVTIKAKETNGSVNLRCKIIINNIVVKEIIQPIKIELSE